MMRSANACCGGWGMSTSERLRERVSGEVRASVVDRVREAKRTHRGTRARLCQTSLGAGRGYRYYMPSFRWALRRPRRRARQRGVTA